MRINFSLVAYLRNETRKQVLTPPLWVFGFSGPGSAPSPPLNVVPKYSRNAGSEGEGEAGYSGGRRYRLLCCSRRLSALLQVTRGLGEARGLQARDTSLPRVAMTRTGLGMKTGGDAGRQKSHKFALVRPLKQTLKHFLTTSFLSCRSGTCSLVTT